MHISAVSGTVVIK